MTDMEQENLSVVLYAPNDLRLETRPILDPGDDEVQISMETSGICGTDIHCWETGCIGTGIMKLDQPIILGHEGCGVVRKIGRNVTNVAIGDRVVVEVTSSCGHCYLCKSGRYNLCPHKSLVGIPPFRDGSLCRYPVVPADNVFKLPDNVNSEEGALMEPLACVVHACKTANIQAGDTVIVLGAGTIGLLCVQTAKVMGASRVAVTDLIPERLELAKQLGADHGFIVSRNDENLYQTINDTMGRQSDVTLECTGLAPSIGLGINVTRPGGAVVVVGIGQSSVEIPLFEATLREVDIKGTLSSKHSFPLAIELVSSGKVDVRSLVTHRFPLDKTLEAFEVVKRGGRGLVKCVIEG